MPVQPAPVPDVHAAHENALTEIRSLVVKDLPPLPDAPEAPFLGDLAPLWRWLSSAQQAARPDIRHPRAALFLAPHGAYPEAQTGNGAMVQSLKDGSHPAAALAREANADLQIYDLGNSGARDFRVAKALEPDEAAHAIAYGMMAVQPGVDLLVLSALNPVAAFAAQNINAALAAGMDTLDTLLRFGGLDVAAMAGAIIAARLARIPVLLDGEAAAAAAALITSLNPDGAAHTRNAAVVLSEKTPLQSPCPSLLLVPLLKSIAKAAG